MLNSVENGGVETRYLGYPIMDISYPENEENMPIIKALNILYEYIYDSKEYMALQGKTQVLNVAVSNPELGLTTRIMHDMHVSQNAMKIASFLGLPVNEILKAKIMGIAHDIGHTPFGHVGEKVLDRELRRFGKGYSFSHAEYSENIFNKLFDECYERIEENDIFCDDLKIYFESLKFSMRKGIRNHPEYYGYKDENEGLAKKSVRLADTLSFMVTDLSDLMRAKKVNGEPILSKERILEELDKIGIDNKEYYEDVIRILENGGGELVKLHEKVIEEAFSTNRRENITTIIDDYKFLQEINSTYEKGDVLNNFKLITEYYNYLRKHKSVARENNEFFYLVSSGFEAKSEKEVFEKMRIICNKIDKIKKR